MELSVEGELAALCVEGDTVSGLKFGGDANVANGAIHWVRVHETRAAKKLPPSPLGG